MKLSRTYFAKNFKKGNQALRNYDFNCYSQSNKMRHTSVYFIQKKINKTKKQKKKNNNNKNSNAIIVLFTQVLVPTALRSFAGLALNL